MCGIAGFLDHSRALGGRDMESITKSMVETLRHRGPNHQGIWVDEGCGLALGHQRLSIIDLSEAGNQPMISRNERYVMSYNGEIYNASEIGNELEKAGIKFRGYSDTEILIEAFNYWGVRDTLKKLIGMFAFALWDQKKRRLTLCRDRVGIKPLYWAEFGDLILFGSELKALKKHPGWGGQISKESLNDFFLYGYVPSPNTIFAKVHKLQPGTIVTIEHHKIPSIERYWSLGAIIQSHKDKKLTITQTEVEERLEELLNDSVNKRLVSDVPLGILLSGGVDSSLVAALAQQNSEKTIKTFTIGMSEESYNEAPYAKKIAQHLQTDHNELYLNPKDVIEVTPSLPEIYDEPFADSSQIPTILISKFAKKTVTVSLSGDGGDEVFLGYNRHYWANVIWKIFGKIHKVPRKLISKTILKIPPIFWESFFRLIPKRTRPGQIGDKLHKVGRIIDSRNADEIYEKLISIHGIEDLPTKTTGNIGGNPINDEVLSLIPDFTERMSYRDTMHYLPDDILTKVDRASMCTSLENRVPLLDHRIMEFVWKLPLSIRMEHGKRKILLKKILSRFIPQKLIKRPKSGFAIPLDSWLRGPLKEWAQSLINESTLKNNEFLDSQKVQTLWKQHQSKRYNYQNQLWAILMFQAWVKNN
jgi:asparagine synthase (glutamine-hydrolysing)|tara:strand:+ start:1011 stop:2942 length:1932 start_codon:yes stop_codon:yes gene_type:complete